MTGFRIIEKNLTDLPGRDLIGSGILFIFKMGAAKCAIHDQAFLSHDPRTEGNQKQNEKYPHGSDKALRHFIPIDYRPPGRNVVGALVLVFQIVGMFPHIEGKQRCALEVTIVHERILLVRG